MTKDYIIIRYIKQCEIDKERKEEDDNDGF